MRAAVASGIKKPICVETVEDPKVGPNDALIKVHASGICRSDWHGWHGDLAWLGFGAEFPAIFGHEFGGEVAEVGANVQQFKEGQRVTTPFHNSCGQCKFCTAGRPNLCDNRFVYGFNGVHGGYAEYVLVPNADANLIVLPDSVEVTAAAALGCRYMTGFHAVNRAAPRPGDWVAVHGAGGVGLSAIQVAAAVGARVIAVDIVDEKLEQAKAAGASAAVNSKDGNAAEAVQDITGGGADMSLDALGIQATITNSLTCLRPGGRHVQVGLTGADEQGVAQVPIDLITALEIELVGSFGNPRQDFAGLLALVAEGRLKPQELIETECSLDDVESTFNRMSDFGTKGFNIITKF